MKKIIIFAGLVMSLASGALAQKLSVSKIEILRDKLIVHYSLDDANPNHNYQVSLYSSKDNFATPLTKVTGDVGTEVKPGVEKKIEWSIVQELGAYKGSISVEVRAGVFVPIVKLSGFNAERKYKRGRTYPLLWTSGSMGGQIDIDLYEGQNRIHSDRNIPNTGKYEYAVPGSVKPGNDYRLKFTNTRNRDEYIFSPAFRIVPRIPFALKAGALLVVVGGTAAVVSGAGGSKDPGNNAPGELADFPEPPGN
ncbi:MAG: Ser-Thr-rich GPI-anchored membrane family protein [Bacteroidota bacterium]